MIRFSLLLVALSLTPAPTAASSGATIGHPAHSDAGSLILAQAPPVPAVQNATADGPASGLPYPTSRWRVVELAGKPWRAGVAPTLTIDRGRAQIFGSTGCNRFVGSMSTNAQGASFGQVATTRMACVSGMAQEARWLKALSATSKLDVADGELTLRDAHGKALARLVPAPEAP